MPIGQQATERVGVAAIDASIALKIIGNCAGNKLLASSKLQPKHPGTIFALI